MVFCLCVLSHYCMRAFIGLLHTSPQGGSSVPPSYVTHGHADSLCPCCHSSNLPQPCITTTPQRSTMALPTPSCITSRPSNQVSQAAFPNGQLLLRVATTTATARQNEAGQPVTPWPCAPPAHDPIIGPMWPSPRQAGSWLLPDRHRARGVPARAL